MKTKNRNIGIEAWQHINESRREAIARAIAESGIDASDLIAVHIFSISQGTEEMMLVADGRRRPEYINRRWLGRLLDLRDVVKGLIYMPRHTALEAIDRFKIRSPDTEIILGAASI